jgi:hypothetical protein
MMFPFRNISAQFHIMDGAKFPLGNNPGWIGARGLNAGATFATADSWLWGGLYVACGIHYCG